jgi:hypothetical protein
MDQKLDNLGQNLGNKLDKMSKALDIMNETLAEMSKQPVSFLEVLLVLDVL